MIHIFKNLNFGGLLALVAGMVLMVSWKSFEKAATKTASGWYEVEQREGQPVVTGNPSEANCNEPDGEICGIELTFDENNVTFPMSLSAAESHPDIVVGQKRYRD